MVRTFQWGILERRTKTDFAVYAKMYSKLPKRMKGCTISILADRIVEVVNEHRPLGLDACLGGAAWALGVHRLSFVPSEIS